MLGLGCVVERFSWNREEGVAPDKTDNEYEYCLRYNKAEQSYLTEPGPAYLM